MITHYLSFDVEDVYQSFKERGIAPWKSDVDGETSRILEILDLLDVFGGKATFFVLTEIISDYQEIIREIRDRGHEIASHGHEHIRIWKRSPDQFAYDIQKSKSLLEDLLNAPIYGYRAPGFSLNHETMWAVDLIEKTGFAYTSSSSFDQEQLPVGLRGENNAQDSAGLLEFPATSMTIRGRSLRLCGGFMFRALPMLATESILNIRSRRGQSVNLYLHPYEFEDNPNRIEGPLAVRMMRYHNIQTTRKKFTQLLETWTFTNFSSCPSLRLR